MLKALFLGVVAVVVLTATAEKPKEKVVVLNVKPVEKKENSLKDLKIPKVNPKELNKKDAVSTLRELKLEDFVKLSSHEKRRLLKKMKKEALKLERLRLIQKLKRKFLQKRKLKLKRHEKKLFMRNLLKQEKIQRMLRKKAKREHKRGHKRHHKRGKNRHQKREKTPEKQQ